MNMPRPRMERAECTRFGRSGFGRKSRKKRNDRRIHGRVARTWFLEGVEHRLERFEQLQAAGTQAAIRLERIVNATEVVGSLYNRLGRIETGRPGVIEFIPLSIVLAINPIIVNVTQMTKRRPFSWCR